MQEKKDKRGSSLKGVVLKYSYKKEYIIVHKKKSKKKERMQISSEKKTKRGQHLDIIAR